MSQDGAESVELVKERETSLVSLGHVLPGLNLLVLERDGGVYVKVSWLLTFFYQCHLDNVGFILEELREAKEVGKEIVRLLVGKREDEWFTLAGARLVVGLAPYRMTRRERSELMHELGKLEPKTSADVGVKAGQPEVVKLKDGQETVIKMRQEEGKDEDGDGWIDVRVVWLGGREYVSTRDVVKHMIEKTGKPVVQAWTRVKAGMDAGAIETHKFKGSGEVVQDVIERLAAVELVRALTGGSAERNRERMLAAICGDNVDAMKPKEPAQMSKEALLDTLDRLYPSWLEEITGQPGVKRAKHS